MTLTLDNFTEADEQVLRQMFEAICDMGDVTGGWWLDKSTINRKSAQLHVKWENSADPMALRLLPNIFRQSPELLWNIIAKLIDYKPETESWPDA